MNTSLVSQVAVNLSLTCSLILCYDIAVANRSGASASSSSSSKPSSSPLILPAGKPLAFRVASGSNQERCLRAVADARSKLGSHALVALSEMSPAFSSPLPLDASHLTSSKSLPPALMVSKAVRQ